MQGLGEPLSAKCSSPSTAPFSMLTCLHCFFRSFDKIYINCLQGPPNEPHQTYGLQTCSTFPCFRNIFQMSSVMMVALEVILHQSNPGMFELLSASWQTVFDYVCSTRYRGLEVFWNVSRFHFGTRNLVIPY